MTDMASISMWDSEVGKTLPFLIMSGTTPLDLSNSTVTMLINNGRDINMTVVSAGSATIKYVTSAANEFRTGTFLAQFKVSYVGGNVVLTSQFQLIVRNSLVRV